jgi:hypothetical protein
MFSKFLGKSKDKASQEAKSNAELKFKISKMNLTDMRTYINNRISDLEVNENGLFDIMVKLTVTDDQTSQKYLKIDDMDSKIKKALELVLSIAKHKKITIFTVELIQEFISTYDDIILKYDTENKQIYASKLRNSLDVAIHNLNEMAELKRRMNIVGE